MNKNPLRELMDTPLTRGQFLKHIGLVAVGLLGVSSFISLLANPERHLQAKTGRYFGSGRFGV